MELLSIVGRSAAVYLFIVVILRVVGKKELSQLSIFNFTLIILISNSVQNAMVGTDTSLQGGLVAAASLVTIDYVLERLAFQYPFIRRLIQGKPLQLIRNGEVIKRNLEASDIALDELQSAVRENGTDSISSVHEAYLETDGKISILTKTTTRRHVRKHE